MLYVLFISISSIAIYHFAYVRDAVDLERIYRSGDVKNLITRIEKLEQQSEEKKYEIDALNKRVEKIIDHIGDIDEQLKSTITLASRISINDYAEGQKETDKITGRI